MTAAEEHKLGAINVLRIVWPEVRKPEDRLGKPIPMELKAASTSALDILQRAKSDGSCDSIKATLAGPQVNLQLSLEDVKEAAKVTFFIESQEKRRTVTTRAEPDDPMTTVATWAAGALSVEKGTLYNGDEAVDGEATAASLRNTPYLTFRLVRQNTNCSCLKVAPVGLIEGDGDEKASRAGAPRPVATQPLSSPCPLSVCLSPLLSLSDVHMFEKSCEPLPYPLYRPTLDPTSVRCEGSASAVQPPREDLPAAPERCAGYGTAALPCAEDGLGKLCMEPTPEKVSVPSGLNELLRWPSQHVPIVTELPPVCASALEQLDILLLAHNRTQECPGTAILDLSQVIVALPDLGRSICIELTRSKSITAELARRLPTSLPLRYARLRGPPTWDRGTLHVTIGWSTGLRGGSSKGSQAPQVDGKQHTNAAHVGSSTEEDELRRRALTALGEFKRGQKEEQAAPVVGEGKTMKEQPKVSELKALAKRACGIANRGWDCYAIAALALLASTPYSALINRAAAPNEEGTPRAHLAAVLNEMRDNTGPLFLSSRMDILQEQMRAKRGEQECALSFLLAMFDTVLGSDQARGALRNAGVACAAYGTCSVGHDVGEAPTRHHLWLLPTPEKDASLDQMLQVATTKEERKDARCSFAPCPGYRITSERVVSDPPDVFIVGFHRLRRTETKEGKVAFVRSAARVAFPNTWKPCGNWKGSWVARSALLHTAGKEGNSGHWTATTLNEGTGTWNLHNDSKVSTLSEGDDPLDPERVCAVCYVKEEGDRDTEASSHNAGNAQEGQRGGSAPLLRPSGDKRHRGDESKGEKQPEAGYRLQAQPDDRVYSTQGGWRCDVCGVEIKSQKHRSPVLHKHINSEEHVKRRGERPFNLPPPIWGSLDGTQKEREPPEKKARTTSEGAQKQPPSAPEPARSKPMPFPVMGPLQLLLGAHDVKNQLETQTIVAEGLMRSLQQEKRERQKEQAERERERDTWEAEKKEMRRELQEKTALITLLKGKVDAQAISLQAAQRRLASLAAPTLPRTPLFSQGGKGAGPPANEPPPHAQRLEGGPAVSSLSLLRLRPREGREAPAHGQEASPARPASQHEARPPSQRAAASAARALVRAELKEDGSPEEEEDEDFRRHRKNGGQPHHN